VDTNPENAKKAVIVAVPETAGSALYGMLDVLASAGRLWQQLVGVEPEATLISPKVASPIGWLAPDEDLKGRYPDVMEWVRQRYQGGSSIYSACSGAIMLAETGLLDGRKATSHWGYQNLFRVSYPKVRFEPEPNLCFADPSGRIVTAGGTSSWHDLAIHIIAKHCSTGEALRIAKVYLLKWGAAKSG
jgi:transcriptional regulator GlxA family with amidase domain